MKLKKINIEKDNKILLISHNDLDGYGAQFLLLHILKNKFELKNDNIKLMNIDYDVVDKLVFDIASKEFDNYKYIFITDLNLLYPQAKLLNIYQIENNKHIFVIDHHKCDKQVIEEFSDWYYVDNKESAAYNVFDWVEKRIDKNLENYIINYNDYKIFGKLVSVYDTWKQKDKMFNIMTLISDFTYTIPIENQDIKRQTLFKIYEWIIPELVKIYSTEPSQNYLEEQFTENFELFFIKKIYKLKQFIPFNDNKFFSGVCSKLILIYQEFKHFKNTIDEIRESDGNIIIVSLPGKNFQYLSNAYMNTHDSKNLVICNYDQKKGTVSCRSRGSGLALKIAQSLGGGGHDDAAGALIKGQYGNVMDLTSAITHIKSLNLDSMF